MVLLKVVHCEPSVEYCTVLLFIPEETSVTVSTIVLFPLTRLSLDGVINEIIGGFLSNVNLKGLSAVPLLPDTLPVSFASK